MQHGVTTAHGYTVRQQLTYVYPEFGNSNTLLVALSESTLDGRTNWTVRAGVTNRQETYLDAANRTRTVITYDAAGFGTTNFYQNGQLAYVDRGALGKTTYGYDAHGRLSSQTNHQANTVTRYLYDDADRQTQMTVSASGLADQITTFAHDSRGRVVTNSLPDGGLVVTQYYPTGQPATNFGARTYPVAYTYDYAGRMETLTTWTDFPNTGAATTTWNYDNAGRLSSKEYPGTTGPSYTYTDAGRLKTRTWQRGITTTYNYDNAGSLTNITYSDSTPSVTNTLDRLGRTLQVAAGADGVSSLAYNDAGLLLSETFTAGPLAGLSVTNGYDSLLRRTTVGLSNYAATVTTYAYDDASRLATVASGDIAAAYGYLTNSALVEQIAFTQNSVTRMTATKAYDGLNRLTKIETINNQPSTINSFSYGYNAANQRTSVTNHEAAYWNFGYDELGQVTNGWRFWNGGTRVAGQQFEYAFDDIGNRNLTRAGGDASGANLRTAHYTNNALNQITGRQVPGVLDVVGTAATTATVAVNDQSVTRQGEYFWKALSVNNTNGAVWQAITNAAVVKGATTNDPDLKTITTNSWFFPQTPEIYSHDADGNLTQDGRWNLAWDGENRLGSMEALSSLPTAARQKLAFTYDSQWRRTSKVVSNWNGTAWTKASEQRFIYDGWNLLAILDESLSVKYSFTWGSDLSGSLQGAGGVGGLLAMKVHTGANAGTYFPAFDGNGNIVAYVSSTSGAIAAQFEFAPFGELIRATGPLARECVFLFSTKFYDWETGLYYYGYRYYGPIPGRWLSRDPIKERGGINLHAFAFNEPQTYSDALGLRGCPCSCTGLKQDLSKPINDHVNHVIQQAKGDPREIFNKLVKFASYPHVPGIETWLYNNHKSDMSGKDDAGRSPCMILCKQCVGSDKLGHFFEEGKLYYNITKLKGDNKYAIGFGEWLEGILPKPDVLKWIETSKEEFMFETSLDSISVYPSLLRFGLYADLPGASPNNKVASKADLAANLSGLRFWERVFADGGRFKFDICDFVSKEWDELQNPNVDMDKVPEWARK